MEALPIVATVAGSLISGSNSRSAANSAAGMQSEAARQAAARADAATAEMKELLAPWVTAGNTALQGQGDLLGINGNPAQEFALSQIRASPMFTSMKKTGEEAILANASATGGLRGGNVQAGLAQFDETLLSKLIEQQYGRLTGLSGQGQSAAGQTGVAGVNGAQMVNGYMTDAAAAGAGGILGVARANNSMVNGLVNGAGMIAGRFGGGGNGGYLPGTTPG